MRACSTMSLTKEWLPRGIATSTMPSSEVMWRLASRLSSVQTSCRASGGRPAAAPPARIVAANISFVRLASSSPTTMTALFTLKQTAEARATTWGRDSRAMPTRPTGTRLRTISRPLGRIQRLICSPMGSLESAMTRKARTTLTKRGSVSVRRSMKPAGRPRATASARSCALAARIASRTRSSSSAMAVRMSRFFRLEKPSITRCATRALRASFWMTSLSMSVAGPFRRASR